MSAIAGRVLQIHNGAYDAATAYSPLDEVLYQGSTYVCKQNSTGNLPTNTTYWQLVAQKGADGSNTDPNAVHYGEQSKGYVGKNKFNPSCITETKWGVTWTKNKNKTISTSGTTSIDGNYVLGTVYLEANNYILNGNPTVAATARLRLSKLSDDTVVAWDDGLGASFTVSEAQYFLLTVRFPNNSNLSGLTFSPMIRLASISDSTYEPYLTPNTDLLSYKDNGILGAKNFCKRTKETQIVGEVTFTVNSDDSVTATASTATTAVRNFEYSRMTLPAGSYRFTGCPDDGDSSTKYGIDVYNNTAGSRIGWDIGDGVEFSLSTTTSISIAISIRSGYDLSNNSKTFYPMICLATDSDSTYVPYAMTNKELTDKVNGIISAATNATDFAAFKTAIGNL